jgi:hypothetical protein
VSSAPQAFETGGLRLLVQCHDWVLALAAECVDRVAARADLPAPRAPRVAGLPAALGRVTPRAEDVPHAAWDLGRLLGLGDVAGGWVLMRLPLDGRRLPVALRTGACIGVHTLPGTAVRPLPIAAFRADRRAAIGGAVALDRLGSQAAGEGTFGLEIRSELLLTRAELELSAAWLDAGDLA